MDNRRLDTAGVMASGILNKRTPDTPIPENAETVNAEYEWEYIGDEAVCEAVEDGKVVQSLNYHGIPFIWKDRGDYRVLLLQYRAITEDHTFTDLDEAVYRFVQYCGATYG